MKTSTVWAVLGAAFLLFACTESGTYPITGEDCAPEDPVQDLSTQECRP